jgi:C_GCAxxG_C_C family probable redox protein
LSETNGPCGALTGAVMALSMGGGRTSVQDGREALYAKTKLLVAAFEIKFGAKNCTGLLQFQLGTPEASADYRARGLNRQCEGYVREAARLAVELLQEGG